MSAMSTTLTLTARSLPGGIDVGGRLWAVTFSASGEYLVSGGDDAVRVWRMKDAKPRPVARMQTGIVDCLAVSKDDTRIAAGANDGTTYLWDAMTYKKVMSRDEEDSRYINAVDFSPNSTQLVSASDNCTAIVRDVTTGKQVQTLRHRDHVLAAKYSPLGDRIATATRDLVRVWSSNDGRLLVEFKVEVAPYYNTGLVWHNDHLFVVSARAIKRLDASTGSVVSEWPVSDAGGLSCIALSKRGDFIAFSTKHTVTFWNTLTCSQLATIQHPEDICSIALSPNDQLLAIGGVNGKISVKPLSCGTNANAASNANRPRGPAVHATLQPYLMEWAKVTLRDRSWKDTLLAATSSGLPRFAIYQVVCDHLETTDRVTDALECFHQLTSESGGNTNLHGEHAEWVVDFKRRSCEKLEHLGDTAVDAQQHDSAIAHYTTALSLNPPSPQDVLLKRGRVYVATGLWQQALEDANRVIKLDPSSPWGYEIRHGALHGAGDYVSAIDTFEEMLSKIAKSPSPDIQRRGDQYISPATTRATIRKIVPQTIRRLPRVLIDTTTGRLHHHAQHVSTFESQPIFQELVSSLTRRIDYVRIKREVRQFFQYVMLSHKWEDNEPLFQQVLHISVYDLDEFPTHNKLQTFCRIVRDAGFNWAWSDTCCIDKSDHFVLQEALVAMFKWYQGSAMTIVFLRGVLLSSQCGALVLSIWNTRAWTLQEYIASKIIRFYTEDWTLYLGLELPNHKDSQEIISEMEQATGVSAQQLIALRTGLTSIREKLRLASTRETTEVEDAAYSLLGIFSVTGVPAIYGEGEASLGRLLAHVLTGAGDIRILAWAGESGSFNSCLPARITVFNGQATSYLPSSLPDTEMEKMIATTQSTSFDLDAALSLCDTLNKLPAPWFAASRMRLPCIAFELPALSRSRTRTSRIYRADTAAFGAVEIRTRQDLSRMKPLYLIHPWLDTLLEREDKSSAIVQEDVPSSPSLDSDDEEVSDSGISDEEEFIDEEMDDGASSISEVGSPSQPLRALTDPMEKEARARRLVAHLRQPFGALLLTLASTGGRAVDYKRVAADSVITVQFSESLSLADILDNVCTLDVL